MSKVFRAVGTVASIAALVPGPHQPIAAAVAAGANIAAQLTAPKPVAKGSVTQTIIEVNPARPYLMGEAYSGGVLRFEVGYGDTRKRVPNPYLWQVKVFSASGPVEGLVEELFEFQTIGSYYDGFYDSVFQLGQRPEPSALVPPMSAPATNWGASSKLSGLAAIGSNALFDKDGKVFANSIPTHGGIWRGVKVYDPRLDDTRTGGSGTHRLGDETTYSYTVNPAIQAGTYAYGRYENGVKTMGIGKSAEAIDWETIAEWANDCDANNWQCHGTIFEGGQSNDIERQRTQNLDDICASGGGRWFMVGGVMSFDWHRPRVPLATLTDDDLLQEGITAAAIQPITERMNGVIPVYVMPNQNWEQLPADEIISTVWRTEDGQPLTQTWPLNLVKDDTQAGQLATYAMADTREIGPIELYAKNEWRFYKPGETITLDSDFIGYNGPAVIVSREFNPVTMAVKMVLRTETDAKHAFAMGEAATPPSTIILGQTPEQKDEIAGYIAEPRGAFKVSNLTPQYPITTNDTEIAITEFTGVLDDGRALTFPAETLTGFGSGQRYNVFWDLSLESYIAELAPATVRMESSRYAFIGQYSTSSGGTFPTPPAPPPSYNSIE